MSNPASSFISARHNPMAITEARLTAILTYVIYCYELQASSGTVYNKKQRSSKQKFEDYLKTKLVDDYLRKNKAYFKSDKSGIEFISFGKEVVEMYTTKSSVEQEDKIDIYISETGLQKTWSKAGDEEVYFAIECKRIETLSDSTLYVKDIKKFVERKHKSHRLPFEGMIAFVESPTINAAALADNISIKIKSNGIVTLQYLVYEMLKPAFFGSYKSIHKKDFGNLQSFVIRHLFLDYSKLIASS